MGGSNLPALAAVVAVLFLAVGSIVVLTDGTDPRIGVIVALVGPTIVGLLALARAERTGEKIEHVERQVNGPLSEMLSHTKGVLFTRVDDLDRRERAREVREENERNI